MEKYPIYLNFEELYGYLKSLHNSDEKISYCKYVLNIFRESFKNKSDADVENYIEKFNLQEALKNLKVDFLFSSHDYEVDSIFSNQLYYALHEVTSHLTRLLTTEVQRLELYKRTIEDGFELMFLNLQIYERLDSFSSDKEKLDWLSQMIKKLEALAYVFTDEMLEKVISLYSLQNAFRLSYPDFKNNAVNNDDKRIELREYLRNMIHDDLKKNLDVLEMSVSLEETRNYLNNGVTNEELIFPIWNFKYNKIKFFCDNAFDSIEYKIQYLSYVIKCLKIEIPVNIQISKFCTELSQIEEELKYLQTSYDLKKSKGTPAKDEINSEFLNKMEQFFEKIINSDEIKPKKKQPASHDFRNLVKHYFEIALKVNRVPKFTELAENNHTVSFWSKRFDDAVFLAYLYNRIKNKIKSTRIKDEKRALFINLSNDVLYTIDLLSKKKSYNTGQTNKHNKEFEEDQFNEKNPYDFNNDDYDSDNNSNY